MQAQSHHLARFSGFRPDFWKAMAHLSSRPPASWPPPPDCLLLCLWFEFPPPFHRPWRSRPPAPSTHPSVCFCSWFWLEPSPSLNSCLELHLWFSVFLLMPRLRGKSKRGAAWYAARGRGSRGRGKQTLQSLPQDSARASTPELPLASTRATSPDHPPERATTPELPPLSSPYACRVEWFDNHGNSLGFAPKLSPEPSSPHQPPPRPPPPSAPPIPSAPLSSSSSPLPSPDSPSSSSDFPPPPPPSFACTRCAEMEPLKDSLDFIKRAIKDVNGAIKEMQNREEDQIRREELLMSLLRDLRQIIPDTGALGKDNAQDRRNEQRPDPSSG
jgi:hypothetical protein